MGIVLRINLELLRNHCHDRHFHALNEPILSNHARSCSCDTCLTSTVWQSSGGNRKRRNPPPLERAVLGVPCGPSTSALGPPSTCRAQGAPLALDQNGAGDVTNLRAALTRHAASQGGRGGVPSACGGHRSPIGAPSPAPTMGLRPSRRGPLQRRVLKRVGTSPRRDAVPNGEGLQA